MRVLMLLCACIYETTSLKRTPVTAPSSKHTLAISVAIYDLGIASIYETTSLKRTSVTTPSSKHILAITH
ncbi:hypothetical protein J6590_030814 [Homalodisca vitripennis]|nr:hypothetical protein J6590_030814 [Homalodisca vitripennis]